MKKYLLLIIVISASAFIILESGEFLNSLYKFKSISYKGYFAAGLLEIFLILSTMIRIRKKVIDRIFSWSTYILIVLTILTSSLLIIRPQLRSLNKNSSNSEVKAFLKESSKQNKNIFSTFAKQGQKTNTALAFREIKKTNKNMFDALTEKKDDNTFFIWLTIGLSLCIRAMIQILNTISAHIFGLLYRREQYNKSKNKKIIQSTVPHIWGKTKKIKNINNG